MRKLLFCCLVFTYLPLFQISGQIPTEGLVAYFPFDGNAKDMSGNNNNGETIGNTYWGPDKNDIPNKAAYFDGTGYIEVNNSESLQLKSNNLSFSLWFKFTGPVPMLPPAVFFEKGPANCEPWQYAFFLNPIDRIVFSANSNYVDGYYPFIVNKWYFVAATWDGTTVNIFVGDSLVNSETMQVVMTADTNSLCIGWGGLLKPYQGFLDEIRIYNRALKIEEIKSLYYYDMVAYYPFNGNANDISGNGFHLNANGSPLLTSDRFSNPDGAYLFNGSSDYFSHSTDSTLFPPDEFTLCIWMYSEGIDGSKDNLISTFENTGKGGYQIDLDNLLNVIESEVRSTTGYQNINSPLTTSYLNKWTFVSYTYSSTGGTKLYLDGALKSQDTNSFQYSASLSDSLRIGNDNVNSYFKGKLDDFRIYNRALTDTEINGLYHENGWVTSFTEVDNIFNYQLSQNYPNPFNPKTTIRYSIPESSNIRLSVNNILGQEVQTIFEGFRNTGEYVVDFDASTLASGVYIYQLQAGSYVETKKMILMK